MTKLNSQIRIFVRKFFELFDSVQKTCDELINAQSEFASINKPILSRRPTSAPFVSRFGVTMNEAAPIHLI